MTTPTPPDWNNEWIIKAMSLLADAGWSQRTLVGQVDVGLELTPTGQQKATLLLAAFRELRCASPEEFANVLAVLDWYLNRPDLWR